jgi:hypothetical protein
LREAVTTAMLMLYSGPFADVDSGEGTGKGAPMRASQQESILASYRDAVEELMEAGEHFGDVEDAIDEVAWLTLDQKAALWLFAFSLRDPSEQQREARAHLAAVG